MIERVLTLRRKTSHDKGEKIEKYSQWLAALYYLILVSLLCSVSESWKM